MSFRPQCAYPPEPDGVDALDFVHAFDGSNTPGLVGTLAAGAQRPFIGLRLETDFPFFWRGWKLDADETTAEVLSVLWKDPFGNFLSSGFVPIQLYGTPSGSIPPVGGTPIILEPEIECPPGAVPEIYILNPTGAPVTYNLAVTLYGLKRGRGCC